MAGRGTGPRPTVSSMVFAWEGTGLALRVKAELMELIEHQIDEDSCYGDIHPNREGDFRDAAVRGKTFLPREIERAECQRDDEEC